MYRLVDRTRSVRSGIPTQERGNDLSALIAPMLRVGMQP